MSDSSCIDDNLKNSRNVQRVVWWHGNWHGSSCVPKIEDFVIRNLQLWRYKSRTIFGLPYAITEGTRNQKIRIVSVERGRQERKCSFPDRGPEFSSDLIFKSIIGAHMFVLGLKCIVICFAGSKCLPLRC